MTIISYKSSKNEDVNVGQSENFLFKLLNSISQGVMLINPDMECVFCNKRMGEFLKISDNKYEISSLVEISSRFGDVNCIPLVQEALEGREVESTDFILSHWDERWFKSVFYPVKDKTGKVELVVRVTQDVSSRRSYEDRLYNQSALVEESNRLKTLFLSNLSHEIRTPMNGILGFVELLEQEEITDTQRYHLGLIRKSSDSLLEILNSLVEENLNKRKIILMFLLNSKKKICLKSFIVIGIKF